MSEALGMIETKGYVAALAAAPPECPLAQSIACLQLIAVRHARVSRMLRAGTPVQKCVESM